jgi:phosphoglycerate dehydrogenase-like enzyme
MTPPFLIGVSPEVITADGGTIFGPEAMKILDDPAVRWEYLPPKQTVITPAQAARYDALCIMSPQVTRDTVSGPDRRLTLVARFGVGYDNVDVSACTDNGVLVTIVPEGVRRPVAASVMAYVLALAHRMLLKDRLVRQGRWAEKGDFLGMGLMGRTLGVIGVGNIGREVLQLARAFDLKLLGCDPGVPQSAVVDLGVTMTDLDTLLAGSDFVSVNCLLDAGTRGLIGDAQFARMKPSAYFINTARGPVVQEVALVRALREGRIAGAAIDVFEQEPTPVDNPLLAFDNVIVAPHAICHTDECMRMLGAGAFRAAVDLAHRRRPATIVDPAALRHPSLAGAFHA